VDNAFPVVVPLAIIAAIVLVIVASVMSARARRQEMSNLAQQLGLDFFAVDMFSIPETYSGCNLFTRGHSRRAYNILSGRAGAYGLKAFDYRYTTGSGKNSQTHFLSAVIIDTNIGFIPLSIRPESFFDRAAAAIGFEDIDFESEEFSRKYYVSSPDKRFAYDVINPKTMEFLLAHPGWSVNLFTCSIMISTGTRFSPAQFRGAIIFGEKFLGLLPDYLTQRLRGS
jgi:hypothetical protein